MTAQARTFAEMLFLSRGVLCADLLTVDTLNGETLICTKTQNGFSYVSDGSDGVEILRIHTHLVLFLGAKFDKRRVNILVDGATHVEGSKGLQDK